MKNNISDSLGSFPGGSIANRPTFVSFFSEKEKFGELSNFFHMKNGFMHKGNIYSTSEHAYQCQKYIHDKSSPDDLAFAEEIRQIDTPYKAKLLANKEKAQRFAWQRSLWAKIEFFDSRNVKCRADWDQVKVQIMEEVLRSKFDQDKMCRAVLISTSGSGIAESSPYDYFWGTGKAGTGKNVLGQLLVRVRECILVENLAQQYSEDELFDM
jgi:ribA/ribD-fused uncharacterized protein